MIYIYNIYIKEKYNNNVHLIMKNSHQEKIKLNKEVKYDIFRPVFGLLQI